MDVGDYAGSYFDLSPWRSAIVVPCYSTGSAWAGGPSSAGGRVAQRTVTYHSRVRRLMAIGQSAGINCRVEGGQLRVGGKRLRVEEGGDCPGVT